MSVNRVFLIGNVGRDPEIRYTQSNVPVANLSVATSERWKDKESGEWVEKTEWNRVVAWRHLATLAENYIVKGKQIYVEGRLETRKWQDKDGKDRYSTEVVANDMMLLGRKEDKGPDLQAPNKDTGHFEPTPAPTSVDDEDDFFVYDEEDLPF